MLTLSTHPSIAGDTQNLQGTKRVLLIEPMFYTSVSRVDACSGTFNLGLSLDLKFVVSFKRSKNTSKRDAGYLTVLQKSDWKIE